MKVKDLKEKLAELPDDLELVSYQHGMEQSGILPLRLYPKVIKVKTEKCAARDAFDGTDYTYERFTKDPNGDRDVCELIMGTV